jgi:hypothetical protein
MRAIQRAGRASYVFAGAPFIAAPAVAYGLAGAGLPHLLADVLAWLLAVGAAALIVRWLRGVLDDGQNRHGGGPLTS